MSTIKYKGFQASVEYEGGSLFIRVLHIDDLLVAECSSADEVEGAFARLIDDYLEACAELGREPAKQFSGSFNIRVGAEVHKQAAMAAADAGQTLNQWVCDAVSEKLECSSLTRRLDDLVTEHARRDMELIRLGTRISWHQESDDKQLDIEVLKLAEYQVSRMH